jgi:hypothetical protein
MIRLALVAVVALQGTYGTLVSDLRNLGLSPKTQIGSASNCTKFTQRWSSYDAPSYAVAIKPANDDDVAKIVQPPF